jgi:hypothetical protein
MRLRVPPLAVILTLAPGEDHVDLRHHRHSDLRPIEQIRQCAAEHGRDILRGQGHGRFSLSRIQAFLLSSEDPKAFIRSRPDIAAILDSSLTGCAVLFSCLDEEIRKVSASADGHDTLAWKNDTFKELLDGLRGQQLAITLLLQLLQMYVADLRVIGWEVQRLTVAGTLCPRSSSC